MCVCVSTGGPATVPRPPPPQSTLPQELTHYTAAEELLGSETAWNKLPIDERCVCVCVCVCVFGTLCMHG